MLLKCIKTGDYHLTLGKNYLAEVCTDAPSEINLGSQVFDYYIVNDSGYRHGVEASLFIRVDELRIKKLQRLGI